jgi:hypothetical protein
MEYTVEVAFGNLEKAEGSEKAVVVYKQEGKYTTDCPSLAFSFGGKNPGRWRVRAKNKNGASEWRFFKFER